MNLSNQKTKLLKAILLIAVWAFIFGGIAFTINAQIPSDYGLTDTAQKAGLPIGDTSPAKLAATIVNSLLGFLGVILVILIIYAGSMWMTAAGDEQKISKAKKLLGAAVVGLGIVLASYAIASFTIANLQKGTGVGNGGSGTTGCVPPPIDCGPGAPQAWCDNGSWSCDTGD